MGNRGDCEGDGRVGNGGEGVGGMVDLWGTNKDVWMNV